MPVNTTVPLLKINQYFEDVPSAAIENMLATIIGPNYELHRTYDVSEKAGCAAGAYGGVEQEYAWPSFSNLPGSVIDESFTHVLAQDAVLAYVQDPTGETYAFTVGDALNQLTTADLIFRTANGSARSGVFGSRDVAIGDVVDVADNDDPTNSLRAKVIGFGYVTVAGAFSGASDGDGNQATVAQAAAAVLSGDVLANVTATLGAAYNGQASGNITEVYTLVCTTAMTGSDLATAVFRIQSASSTDDVASMSFVDWDTDAAVGTRGLLAKLTDGVAGAISVGDTIAITVTSAFTAPTLTIGAEAYTGPTSTAYVVRVVSSNAAGTSFGVVVETSTNLESTGVVTMTTAELTAVGIYGAEISLDEAPCVGDVFYFSAAAASQGACNTLLLSRSLPAAAEGNTLGLTMGIEANVTIPEYSVYPGTNYVQGNDGVTLNAGLTVAVDSLLLAGVPAELPIVDADIFITYRAKLVTYAHGRAEVANADDVITLLGAPCTANPLALGVYLALLNSNGRPVGFIATGADEEPAAYAAALELLEDETKNYSLVPMTQDPSVQSMVQAHVEAQSMAGRNHFRICWLNSPSTGSISLIETGTDAEDLAGQFSLDGETAGNTLFTSPNSEFLTDGVRAGDTIRVNYRVGAYGDEIFDAFVVDEVIAENTLRTMTGPALETGMDVVCQVWRTQSAVEQSHHFAAMTGAFDERRVRHIWPAVAEVEIDPIPGGTPGWSVCAALAGQQSGLPPHQPMTTLTLQGFSGVWASRSMRDSNLDIIAAMGTWVVTQDEQDGAVYTRMAFTTDISSVNTWQPARTVNADSVSFAFVSALQPYVGTANISNAMLVHIGTTVSSLTAALRAGSNVVEIGPQILEAEIVDGPRQNPVLKDSAIVGLALTLPYAMDQMVVNLQIS